MAQYLLKEDGFKVTQESADGLLIWFEFSYINWFLKKEDGFYILEEDGASKIISSRTLVTNPVYTKALGYSLVGQLHAYKEIRASLYTDLTPLSTEYTSTEYTNAASDNGVYVSVGTLQEGQYAVHQFALGHGNNTDQIILAFNVRCAIPTTAATAHLQIYNFNTTAWEDVATDSATAANTDFNLAGTVATSLSNYFSSKNVVYIRVYQKLG